MSVLKAVRLVTASLVATFLLGVWLAPVASASRRAPSPTSAPAPTLCNVKGSAAGSEIIRQADRLAADGKTATAAQHLYDVVLADAGSTPTDRDCAARGLAVLATAPVKAAQKSAGQRAQSAWDSFYASTVSPAQGYGVPALVVFVLLVALARWATAMVPTKVAGPSSRALGSRILVKIAYAVGVLSIALSAVALTVGLSWARDAKSKAAAGRIEFVTGWTVVGALVVAVTMACFWVSWTRRARPGEIEIWPIVAGGLLAVAACLSPLAFTGDHAMNFATPPLKGTASGVIESATPLALVGIVIVSWIRGTGLGVRFRGHDAKGVDDAGLAQQVLTRLQAIGSHKPRGIQTVQQTDVSTLPGSALSLLPDGTLSKALAFVVQLFQPATPWSIDVADCADGGVNVIVARNGRTVDSDVIRVERLGFTPPASDAKADAGIDRRQLALSTASAAYALVTLSKYNRHLADGLTGATKWPSVAAQSIATDPSVTVGDAAKRRLLAHAVAFDSANLTARAALLLAVYRADGAGHRETVDYASRSKKLLGELSERAKTSGHGYDALRLRLLFNLVVANGNLSLICRRELATPAARDPEYWYPDDDLRAICKAADEDARKYANQLRSELDSVGRDLSALKDEMDVAVKAVDKLIGRGPADKRADYAPDVGRTFAGSTMLGLFEQVCVDLTDGRIQAALWNLSIVTQSAGYREWARQDESMARLWTEVGTVEARRAALAFKKMVGDPGPQSFLDLDSFADYRADLQRRRLTDPAEFGTRRFAQAVSQLGVSANLLAEWRGLAELYLHVDGRRAADVQPSTTEIVHALGRVGVRTVDQLRARTADDEQLDALHWKLIVAAQGYAFTIPPRGELQRWRDAQPD